MAVIDPLLDHTLRHAVDTVQYSNYVTRRLINLLNKVDSDIIAALSKALEGIDQNTFKIQRLDALLFDVRDLNAQAHKNLLDGLSSDLRAFVEYEAGFQYSLFANVAPVTVSFTAIVAEQAYAAAMALPMQGRLLKDWASGLEQATLRKVKDTIAIGYMSGKPTQEIVRELFGTRANKYADGLLKTSRSDVEAIVRTALSHHSQMVRTRFYDENESLLGDIVWIATLDSRTSSQCRARDHKHYTIAHKPIGHSLPWLAGAGRLHWNCRSTSIAFLAGQKSLTGSRSSADGYVDANVTYSEWLKSQPANVQDDALGKARGKAYREGGMKEDAFVNNKSLVASLKEIADRDARAFAR